MTGDTEARPMTRAEREAAFTAVLEYFTTVLVRLERGNPRKLCIDGREYRRRQKSQRRKNRARGR